ncbi:sushi, von Willebrand factor type A, EGF and pentraxin domain-containing protein 1-like isoform X2 [Mercenaria mercenaria]|uniref:sushi, von Willebrand factor type A, EGF and pentraxin domain-containing protein 1-like isoform X2 n=1 Tax=Mercenaria mercenaria TaxID=6596 RepID=UPI00234E7DB4|nr:sushi, von Willebrand factor type A, EGF and pentraxin domain-containing protein 1-like isoform X2 [Mercenaria mercenaria]
MMYMTTIVSLTLLVMAYHVEAYSAGAPEAACQTMVPGHQATSLSSDPFYVNVSSDYYCPGEDIHIDIGISAEGNAAFQGFKGFLCKANLSGILTESMHEAGTLTATVPYHNVCSEFPSVTHASNTLKTDLHLIWRSSSRVTSTQMQVKINCTIVIDFSTYKLGITTRWITQGLQQECNGTSAAAPSCAAGSYYNLTQQACVLCPAGYFCPPNTWTYEDYACLAGYYCPTGSSLPTQVPCPPGTYRADTLGTSITDCHLCPCGKYCDMNALSSPTGDCNEGYYCIEGAESATPTDGISGNSCSSGYICPAGSCKQTACIEGYNCTYADPCHCFPPSPPQNGNVQIISVMGVQAVFTCDVGYEFAFPDIPDERSYGIYCWCGEWRGFTNVTCAPVDCGGNATLNNGYIYYGDGTTFGAASVFVCNTGYRLNGLSSAVCMASGQWSRPIPECELVDCGLPRYTVYGFISDPPANSIIATTFNSVITYECNDGFLLKGHKSRRCLSSGVWSGHIPLCVQVLGTKPEPCINDIDDRGTVWEITPPGMVSTKPCLDGFQGVISRNCTALGQWLLPTYNCVRETLDEITKLVEGAAENPSESLVSTILTNLSDVTTSGADDILYEGELQLVTTTLENIVDISQNITIDDSQTQNFIRTASNLVDKKNADSWKSINQANEINNITENGPAGVLRAVDGYSEVIANSTTSAIEIKEQNIVFRVANYTNNGMENIRFPVQALAEELRTSSFYFLSNISLEGVKQYSSVFYKNLTEILPTSTSRSYSSSEINGAVLTLKLIPYKNHLESPLELHFQHFNTFYKNPVCSYWNFDSNGWDNEGCTVTSTNSEETSCKCNHLTNFAILMSPYKQVCKV